MTALTNTPITMDCAAIGIPKPTITWTKDGQELSSGSGYVRLVIEKASTSTGGTYTCIARNIEGNDTVSSTLKVYGKFPKTIRIYYRA